MKFRTSRRLGAVALVLSPATLSLAACSTGESASIWAGTVTDSAGIQIVQNPTEGMWAAGEEWVVEEVLSIGEVLGDEEYQFGQIISVDVDASAPVGTRAART